MFIHTGRARRSLARDSSSNEYPAQGLQVPFPEVEFTDWYDHTDLIVRARRRHYSLGLLKAKLEPSAIGPSVGSLIPCRCSATDRHPRWERLPLKTVKVRGTWGGSIDGIGDDGVVPVLFAWTSCSPRRNRHKTVCGETTCWIAGPCPPSASASGKPLLRNQYSTRRWLTRGYPVP